MPDPARLQQVAAVLEARELLRRLVHPSLTPRVPRPIRFEARAILRRLPSAEVLRSALEGASLQDEVDPDSGKNPGKTVYGISNAVAERGLGRRPSP